MSKSKNHGCGCQKRGRGCSPKLIASMCHMSCGSGYHPAARARIERRRLEHALLVAGAGGVDDVEL